MQGDLADQLIATLPYGRDGLFNPWRDHCPHDSPENGPEQKLERLRRHLACSPRFILVGEAPGYQGCRYAGVAFTSERLLMEGGIPRIPATGRLSTRHRAFSEPSATIVWRTLTQLGIANCTVMWNAIQLHPYKAGELWSNRTPSSEEIALGAPALGLLREAFPTAQMVAIGNKAEELLLDMGVQLAGKVRHPANGGTTKFAQGLTALVKTTAVL